MPDKLQLYIMCNLGFISKTMHFMLIIKNLLIFMSSLRYCCILCVLGFSEQKSMVVKSPNANEIKIAHEQQVTLHNDHKIS
jgi:hypothetical protein